MSVGKGQQGIGISDQQVEDKHGNVGPEKSLDVALAEAWT